MARWSAKEWRKAVDSLKVLCPLAKPVSVVRTKLPEGDYGDADYRKGKFYIRVDKSLEIHHSLMVLVHEMAHARTWTVSHDRSDHHDAHFGVAYAECYRAVFYE